MGDIQGNNKNNKTNRKGITMNIEESKLQMHKILDDTADYYGEDPEGRRAVDDCGDCEYTTWDGRHCAIGRYMKPEYQTDEFPENHGVGIRGLNFSADNYLVSEVRGLDENFWGDLQDFHDVVGHWYRGKLFDEPAEGLTEIGRQTYTRIKDKIERGEYND